MGYGSGPGPIPPRWLNCPRKSDGLVANRFLTFFGYSFIFKKTEMTFQFSIQILKRKQVLTPHLGNFLENDFLTPPPFQFCTCNTYG